MAMTLNDIQSQGLRRVSGASGSDILSGPARIQKISVTAAAATASILVYNALTATGTDLVGVSAVAGTTATLDLGPQGSNFDVGVSTTLSGAGAGATIFYQR